MVEKKRFFNRDRLTALVDGIFTVAMTIMVVSLVVPETNDISNSLIDMWPALFNYALSFFILGMFWVTHNKHYLNIEKTDEKYVWLNIIWLMFVVLVPFSTSLISTYSDVTAAEIFFHLNMLAIFALFYLQVKYVDDHRELLGVKKVEPKLFERVLTLDKRLMLIALLGIILAFVIPDWSNTVYLLSPFVSPFFRKKKK